jgi:2-amino-4-hydroxy-6-hydroxymethyldihydropteridine diphosphokinase
MQNKTATVILGLGTNLGDKINNLNTAIFNLKQCGVKVLKQSRLYQSPPWGFVAKDDFYNMALQVSTLLSPEQLLIELKAIELKMGRPIKSSLDYSSRIIDIDILDYNMSSFESPELEIPHKHMHKRSFALFPLKDVNQNYVHPNLALHIDELIALLDDNSITVVNKSLCVNK